MWLYHCGPQWAKRLTLTGDMITGAEAAQIGLVMKAVPADLLEAEVDGLAGRLALIDADLLSANKRIINMGLELMGARTLQRFAAENDARAHRRRGRAAYFAGGHGRAGSRVRSATGTRSSATRSSGSEAPSVRDENGRLLDWANSWFGPAAMPCDHGGRRRDDRLEAVDAEAGLPARLDQHRLGGGQALHRVRHVGGDVGGTTTAPWRSAWTRSPGRTTMPATSPVRRWSTTWT